MCYVSTVARTAPNATRRSQSARRAILAAALDQVAEVGYARLSIEGIAAAAGVGKQTIYRWWPSKGAVLLDSLLALSEGQDGEVMALPDTGDLEADLKLVLRATVDELTDSRYDGAMRALTAETLRDPALAAMCGERLEAPIKALKLERLRSAQAAGDLRARARSRSGHRRDLGAALQPLASAQRAPDRGYADQVVERALDGLR